MRNRVVIVGLGVTAANGNGASAFWTSLLERRSGVGPVTQFDASSYACRIAGEVKGLGNPRRDGETTPGERRMARATRLALVAAREALADAGVSPEWLRERRSVPLFMGVSTTAMDLREQPPHSWSVVAGIPHAVVSAIPQAFGFQAQMTTLSDGCASGLDAIGMAYREIRRGAADLAIAGAADSAITPYVFTCFCRLGRVSHRNDDPERADRPFDRNRDGGVIAEGSAIVILEDLDHALARGAVPYGEVAGYGTMADHPSAEEGSGMAGAMKAALANAAMRPDQLEHINAHGPGDSHMDEIESRMIASVLGPRAGRTPVMSIKGATGNPMGVGGAHQVVTAALTLRHNAIPPTTNLDEPDAGCPIDLVMGESRPAPVNSILVNTHGFGRDNSSLILKRWTPGVVL